MTDYTDINDAISNELLRFGDSCHIPADAMGTFVSNIILMIKQAQESAFVAGVSHGVLQQLYSDRSLTIDIENDEDDSFGFGMTDEEVEEIEDLIVNSYAEDTDDPDDYAEF